MGGTATVWDGLASVIVPCDGRPGAIRRCVAALLRHTRRPWELIAVADGLDGDGAAYLGGIKDAAPIRVEILTDARGGDRPSAFDRAIVAARGDYVVVLDAAAVVADGWLDQLVALAESDPAIGLVGPMSDGADGPQRAEGPAGDDPEAVARFAARWRDERRGKWFTVEVLSGPCILLKRRTLEAIGPLDGRSAGDPIAWLTARAQRAGVAAAVAYDLFVHRSPRSVPAPAPPGRVAVLAAAEFARRFGDPDTSRALCGYTKPHDTHAVLTLLAFARPSRILEVGTALGHMTANLAAWSPEEARVYSLGVVRGMDPGGAAEQGYEAPDRADFGRLAGALGAGHKVELVVADSRGFDFRRLAPLDFAFVDGGHGLELALADARGAYEALAPGGWLVWHVFDSPLPWVRVREAIERLAFPEPVHHVAGTEVAFLRKAGPGPDPLGESAAPAGPLRVTWEGDHRGVHSLGLINRALIAALLDRGHDLGIDPGGPVPTDQLLPPDPRLDARLGQAPAGGPAQVRVAHRWPPRLDPPPEGRWVVFQPWEFGSLPRAWLRAVERADEVWAYSDHVRGVYLDAGVPAEKVHVVPLGVDPEVFRPGLEPLPLPPGPGFRFLFVGGTIHRKGIDILLEAFARAFAPGDGVGLVVQDMGAASFYRGQTAGARVAALRELGYAVEYRAEALTPPELARLYAACDCLVQPYRGEGFALPVAEAMACGRPVIVTGAGPVLDYAGPATAYFIPARRVELPGERVGEIATVGRPWLWEPDGDALTGLLRRVAGDPAAAKAKGEAAGAWIRGRFTWAHAAAAAEARLRELVDRPAAGRVAVAPGAPATDGPAGAATESAVTPARRAKVSLTMIVKNEEANLPACLGSAAGVFDEVVVLDTGSTDRTVAIARAHGARVFDFVWVDDFAAARNAALARATGDFAFWLDADDVLDPPQRDRLQALLAGLRGDDPAGYVVRCRCDPGPDGTGGDTVVDHIRLFPVREDVRWAYAVHEQILPALRRAGIPVRWTDVVVRHTGYTDPALRGRKLDRDAAILEAELAERPDDPFVLFNLGAIAVERQDWRAALDPLRRSLAGSAPADSITRKLYALIARCHQMLGERELAVQTCNLGLATVPDDAELLFRRAVLHRHGGDLAAAAADWERILTLRRPEQFASVDQGIYGHLTRRNLATVCEQKGDAAAARRHWQAVLAECPGDRDATEHLSGLGPAGASP
jgi:glycosyltransferase involved in cell wall biosynthesis